MHGEFNAMHVHETNKYSETVSHREHKCVNISYGRPMESNAAGTSQSALRSAAEQDWIDFTAPTLPHITPSQTGETDELSLGNFFDPNTWLPDSFPSHLTATSPHLREPYDNESAAALSLPIQGTSPPAPRSMQPQGDSQIDDIVDWPVVLAFLTLYHERL